MKHLSFLLFKGKSLFNFVGVPVGRILDEDGKDYLVMSQEQVADTLEKILGKDDYVPNNPMVLEVTEAAKQAGLLPTFTDVVKAFRAKELPKDFQPEVPLSFLRCDSCGVRVPHGHFYFRGERVRRITNLLEGLYLLDKGVSEQDFTPETGTHLFQKMVEACILDTAEQYREQLELQHPEAKAERELVEAFGRFIGASTGRDPSETFNRFLEATFRDLFR